LVEVQDAEELAVLRRTARECGADLEDVELRDLGVTTAVFIVGLTAMVFKTVERWVKWRVDRQDGGQVIDLRPGQVLARRDPGLMPGLLLLVTSDGEIEVKMLVEGAELQDVTSTVINSVLSTGTSGAEAVAAVVQSVVGDRAAVTPRAVGR